MQNVSEAKIAVVGLGYVGLPLAVEFGKQYPVVGYDLDSQRIKELVTYEDKTLELSSEEIQSAKTLTFTSNQELLASCSVFVVTVPTPIDKENRPDLQPLISASKMIAAHLKCGDVVIYESTVYPGATEEICRPLLEEGSGLLLNDDFYLGYSPERINPGDKKRSLTKIMKVTSGSNSDAARFVDALYKSVIQAGTHLAPTIKVAEAAKVIENTQRDLNIALMNELAMVFDKLGVRTADVLAAAKTKWNFLPFEPGLVGGHCISVDPYYLTHKAQSIGYIPEVILAGRRINDGMGEFVANRFIREAVKRGIVSADNKALVLGLTFKENCPDIRNSRTVDIIDALEDAAIKVDVYDPYCSPADLPDNLKSRLLDSIEPNQYIGVIIAVKHSDFAGVGAERLRTLCCPNGLLFDVKGLFDPADVDFQL